MRRVTWSEFCGVATRCCLIISGALWLAAFGQSPDPVGASDLWGHVLRRGSGEGIRRATVILVRSDVKGEFLSTTTDNDGGFRFNQLPPGAYRLTVSHPSYLAQEYAAPGSGKSGSLIRIPADPPNAPLTIALMPQATLAGRVTDEDGEPAAGAEATALRIGYRRGQRELVDSGRATTGSNGEFRIGALAPGRYLVKAGLHRHFRHQSADKSNAPPELGYAATFYPNSVDTIGAVPIRLSAGADVTGIEIRLQVAPVVHVKGRVVTTDGVPVASAVVVVGDENGTSVTMTADNVTRSRADGSFDMATTSGSYYVMVMPSGQPDNMSANVPVTVGDRDVEVTVRMGGTATITGSITLENGEKKSTFAGITVQLRPVDGFLSGYPTVPVTPEGEFRIPQIAPGRFQVAVYGLPETTYVRSARLDGDDVSSTPINLQAGFANRRLEIAISDAGATVQGRVTDLDSHPVPDALVALIPDSGRSDHYKTAKANSDGSFAIRGICPGAYTALALPATDDEFPYSPEIVKRLSSSVNSIKLVANELRILDLTALPRDQE